ncbi:MAG: YraN family protein [Clostridia bacterium]|nr:YraN family protein [Clostridia bacterium]
MYERHVLGKQGEDAVSDFLLESGYEILERNYQCKIGEIDIIALDVDEIVFIEVKTRSQERFGSPADAVDGRKKRHIYRTAEYYVMMNELENRKIRFDVIEVKENGEDVTITQIKKAIIDKPRGC